MSDKPITVLIADDHGIVREGLRTMLEREGLDVVAEATTGREAIAQTELHTPDVVLLDIRMPDLDGFQALSAIKQACPQTCVIMLTSHTYPAYLSQAITLGAAGFLSKEVDPATIPATVRAAVEGHHLLDPIVLRAALAAAAQNPIVVPATSDALAEPLTEAEQRVLRQIAHGLDNATIAETLHLSINTIKTHVRHILGKLQVSDRTQAALWAVQNGYA